MFKKIYILERQKHDEVKIFQKIRWEDISYTKKYWIILLIFKKFYVVWLKWTY